MNWLWRAAGWLGGALMLSGCAVGPLAQPEDPLEPLNRAVFQFNETLDRALLKPVAGAYQDAVPELARRGVGNFFGNLEDAWSVVNSLLQFKGLAAADNLMRVSVNTLFGFGGLLDIASEMRIERHTEDFGQTLGHWGVGAGPYLVLPLLGPSSVRDAAARPVDVRGDAVAQTSDVGARNSLWALRAVHGRAGLLKAVDVLEQAALDKYTFVRDAYLQRRRNLVFDGNPPEEPFDSDQGQEGNEPR